VAAVGDRLYLRRRSQLLCLTLSDGKLVYKTTGVGSVEGSVTYKDGRIYLSTENFDLYCINAEDGKVIWKARIGADSDSTPAVVNGMVYHSGGNGSCAPISKRPASPFELRDSRRSCRRAAKHRHLGQSHFL